MTGSARRRLIGVALGGLIQACAGAAAVPTPLSNEAGAARAGASAPCPPAAPEAAPTPQLRIQLKPVFNDDGGVVHVTLNVTGPAEQLRSWRVPALNGALDVQVTVAPASCGAAPVRQRLQGTAGQLLAVALPAGAATATLQLEYTLPPQRLAPPYWRLEPDWFLGQGRRLLLLPAERSWQADVSVQIDATHYGPVARGVSSLGLVAEPPAPPRPLSVSLPALEQSLFAAGWLGSAQFDAPEGHDEAAWFGSTMFDVRLLAAEVASFRTAVRELLRDGGARPLTLILVSDGQHGFEARRAPVSVLVRVAVGERLSAGLRLEVLQQVMKEWIGGQLSVRDEAGAEPLWFGEGLSRFLARELALEFGLISPEEFAADVNGLMAMQAVLARHECVRADGTAGSSAAEGAAEASEGETREAQASDTEDADSTVTPASVRCARVLSAARGILHASELDVALRARSSSLLQLISGLLARSAGVLPVSEWRAALASAGGEPALQVHEAFLAAGSRPLLLPSAVFGPCFVREPTRFGESLLGFAVERSSSEAAPWRVAAVQVGSPAAAAGLKVGAQLQRIEHIPYDTERSVRLVQESGLVLEYRGAEARVPGFAWRRVPGVKDARCRMSGR